MYVHLKELRESLGMTQEEFGKSIGIAKSTYNNYEKGIRDPKSDFWITVAKKYGVTIDYLMGYTNEPHKTTDGDSIEYSQILNPDKPMSKPEQKLMELFLRLDDRARSALLGYANRLAEELRDKPDVPMDIDSQLEYYRRGMLMGIATAQADFSIPPEDINIDDVILTPELEALVDGRLEEQRRILEAEQQKEGNTTPATDNPETPPEGE